jgi:preprotein translocase subunit SecE
MARHRQRARDRKQQRQGDEQHLHRENVPGPLEHGGEVDEVEASIVAGAGGLAEPVDDDELAREALGGDEGGGGPLRPVDRGGGDGGEGGGGAPGAAGGPKPGGNRFINFLRACWAELQRVQWPDRRQTTQGTAVVLGFVVVAGAYLGAADAVAQVIIDAIL